MIYLDAEASRCYLDTTKIMFHSDMVSWAHYLDRMVALRSMTLPDDPSHVRASRVLSVEEWDTDNEWLDEGNAGDEKVVTRPPWVKVLDPDCVAGRKDIMSFYLECRD
jgi:hypothetical protein